jgi:hypothetical protein
MGPFLGVRENEWGVLKKSGGNRALTLAVLDRFVLIWKVILRSLEAVGVFDYCFSSGWSDPYKDRIHLIRMPKRRLL